MMSIEMIPASRRLARAAAATRWADLPAAVRRQALDLFFDTLAVIAAGSVHPGYAPWVRSLAGESGPCTVLGASQGLPAASAALLNGGATTVLQWQDGHRLARGHPASHLVPALLALAEAQQASAETLLTAFVAGYETGTRIGIALGGLQAPVHDAGTWATLGAAAGCVCLLGGDAPAIERALEGAAAVAPLPYRDTVVRGAGVHHLYVGIGATTALATAKAALAGLTAIPGTIEAFFGPRAGAAFRAAALTDGLDADHRWSRHELLAAYIKWHPVCAHFSGLADALEQLQRESLRVRGRPLSHDEVAAVEVRLYATALDYEAGLPHSDLAARFSATAIVYAALDAGGLRGPAFGRVVARDPVALAWLPRVRIAHDPALDAGYPAGRPASVTLRLADGTTCAAQVTDVYGDQARPMSAVDRRDKAQAALACRYGMDGARAVRGAFDDFVAGGPIARFSEVLRMPAAA